MLDLRGIVKVFVPCKSVFGRYVLILNKIQTDFYFCRHFVKSPIDAFVREELMYIIIVSDK